MRSLAHPCSIAGLFEPILLREIVYAREPDRVVIVTVVQVHQVPREVSVERGVRRKGRQVPLRRGAESTGLTRRRGAGDEHPGEHCATVTGRPEAAAQ